MDDQESVFRALREKGIREEELREKGELPKDLDLILIDGKWGQVTGGGTVINYLEDGTSFEPDWSQYKLEQKIQAGLNNLGIGAKNIQFPLELVEKIHWELPIEGEDPKITKQKKMNIHVFGVFTKKN